MHPAYSIIFFTSLSGAGYGLILVVLLSGFLGFENPGRSFSILFWLLAFCLITAGLLSSLLHLKHPERAWRAISQWRSSWLSREGVFALVAYPIMLISGFYWIIPTTQATFWDGFTILLVALTLFSTSMIYASLKTVPNWHQPITVLVFFACALAAGSAFFVLVLALTADVSGSALALAVLMILILLGLKWYFWAFRFKDDAKPEGLSPLGAQSLSHGSIRIVDQPHAHPNYVQREMGYKVARKHGDKLRVLFSLCCLAAMLLVILTYWASGLAILFAILAVLVLMAGIIMERWLFFAQAGHVVSTYYEGSTRS